MRLPGAAAYMEAVQDPGACFADPELASASPLLGPLGLPRAVSGNVAVVFRLEGKDGRAWAVRCFVRPVDAERARYDAIRAHLANLDSTWRVAFDLQPCGIRVDGQWWPVLKMEWAPGEPLLTYVHRHLWDGAALGYLAARFASLTARLRADGVAHGDLQHGNILVVPGGDLRLVDYDGMYVPALAGRGGTERGHRNYQHPGREVGDFDPVIDSFSAWVIYASLAALAADPLLWGRLDGGEEALLLRHHDLEEPDRSAALAAMEASDGPGVAALARLLRSFLAMRPGEVPSLSPALARAAAASPPAVPTHAATIPPPSAPSTTPAGAAPARVTSAPAGAGTADGDRRRSLYDALTAGPATTGDGSRSPAPDQPAPQVEFVGDLHDARVTLAAGGVATAMVLLVAVMTGAAPALAVLGALTMVGATLSRVHRLFVRTPEAQAVRLVGSALSGPRRAVEDAVAAIDDLARRRADVDASEAAAAAQAAAARAGLRADEEQELRAVDAALEAALAGLAERGRGIARAEQEARAAALAVLQGAVIDAQLGQHSLVTASACGVDDTVVHRLGLDGVHTAADFTTVFVEKNGAAVVRRDGRRLQVSGVDQRQASAMVTWRRRVSEVAQLKVPHALPPERLAAIRAGHDADRAALAGEAERARAEARHRADGIRARWEAEHELVVQRQKRVETDAARQRVDLDREVARARKDVAEAQWRLGQHQEVTGPPAELRLSAFLREVVAVGPLAKLSSRRHTALGHGRAGWERPPGL